MSGPGNMGGFQERFSNARSCNFWLLQSLHTSTTFQPVDQDFVLLLEGLHIEMTANKQLLSSLWYRLSMLELCGKEKLFNCYHWSLTRVWPGLAYCTVVWITSKQWRNIERELASYQQRELRQHSIYGIKGTISGSGRRLVWYAAHYYAGSQHALASHILSPYPHLDYRMNITGSKRNTDATWT